MIKPKPSSEKRLGEILVARGIISQRQLNLALKIKAVQPDKYLGEILFKLGVPQEKINRTLYYSHKRKTIGEVLRDQELISSDQLEQALRNQKTQKEQSGDTRPLGLLLIEMGYINSRGYLTALSKHFNMPILSMKDYEPNALLLKIIGERYAIERRIIVLENGDKTVKLVLAEPSMQIMEELRKAVPPSKMIEFHLASHSLIDECFSKMVDILQNSPLPTRKAPIRNEQQRNYDRNVLIISNENRRIV